jgi:16S rRNA G966 N2-methylase RsmD
MNRLLFDDNLKWLRDAKVFPDASVDLVYLDPPFNSNADYNVLFREASGEASQAQSMITPRKLTPSPQRMATASRKSRPVSTPTRKIPPKRWCIRTVFCS